MHFGQLLKETLHKEGRTVTWFAAQLCCTRCNVYKIFEKEHVDTQLVLHISKILNHNFFNDLAKDFNEKESLNE